MTTEGNLDGRIDLAIREAEGRKRAVFDRMHNAEKEREQLVQERDALVFERDEALAARDRALEEAYAAQAERDRMFSYCDRMLGAMSWDKEPSGD